MVNPGGGCLVNVETFIEAIKNDNPLGRIKLIESLEKQDFPRDLAFFRAVAQCLNSPSEYVRCAASRLIFVKFPLDMILEPLVGVIVREPVFWPAKQAAAMAFCRAPAKQLMPLLDPLVAELNQVERDEFSEVLNTAGAGEIMSMINSIPSGEETEPAAEQEPPGEMSDDGPPAATQGTEAVVPPKAGAVAPRETVALKRANEPPLTETLPETPRAVPEPAPAPQESPPVIHPVDDSGADGDHEIPPDSGDLPNEAERRLRLKILLSSLTKLDIDLSSEIAFALSNFAGDELVNSLVDLLHRQKNSFSRAIMVQILGMLEIKMAVDYLIPYLRDEDRRVRANAVEAIGQIGEEKHARLLIPLLEDPDNRVRANTARALWSFGGLRAINILVTMLKDPRKWIRASGAYALGEIGAIQVVEPLLDALADPDSDVRVNVVRALGKTSDGTVSKPLMRLVVHLETPPEVRVAAVEALGRLTAALGTDYLSVLLQEPLLPEAAMLVRDEMERRGRT